MPNHWLRKNSALTPLALVPLANSTAQAQDADASPDADATETVIVTGTRAQYPAFSPFGINGAYYCGKISFSY